MLAAVNHDSLPAFSAIMVGYVLPLTVITLIVSFIDGNNKAMSPA